jgi:energy-coupling factor transporter transmembrane protein EcfT
MSSDQLAERNTLSKQLDATTWGLLLLATGVLLILPGNMVPEGAWLIVAGAILLIMSGVRYAMKLGASTFVIALGLVAVVGGLSSAAGLRFPLFAAFLILVGAALTLRTWLSHAEA